MPLLRGIRAFVKILIFLNSISTFVHNNSNPLDTHGGNLSVLAVTLGDGGKHILDLIDSCIVVIKEYNNG